MPKGQFVNRSARTTYQGYTGVRISGMSDLDRIATHLLATNYSRNASPTAASQKQIQRDCVAVVWIGYVLYAASNNRGLEDADFEAMMETFGPFRYNIVNRGHGGMHAEMQLLQEMMKRGLKAKGDAMGVSKPCCKKCAIYLDVKKVAYSQWHNTRVVVWEPPE